MNYTKRINDPFLYNKPILDLHGETGEISRILTKEFIIDNARMGEKVIIIIHGKGSGIVRKSVYNELKTNKNVLNFNLNIYNEGMTIVNLK